MSDKGGTDPEILPKAPSWQDLKLRQAPLRPVKRNGTVAINTDLGTGNSLLGKRKAPGIAAKIAQDAKRQKLFDKVVDPDRAAATESIKPGEVGSATRLNARLATAGRRTPWQKTEHNVVRPPNKTRKEELQKQDGYGHWELGEVSKRGYKSSNFHWDRDVLEDPRANPFVEAVRRIKAGHIKDPLTLEDYARGDRDIYFAPYSTDYEVVQSRELRYDERLQVIYDSLKPNGEVMAVKAYGHDPYLYVRIPESVSEPSYHSQEGEAQLQRYLTTLMARLNGQLQEWTRRVDERKLETLCWVLPPDSVHDPCGLADKGTVQYAQLISRWELLRTGCRSSVGYYQRQHDEMFVRVSVRHPMLIVPAKEALWNAAAWVCPWMQLDEPFVHHAQGPIDGRRCLMALESHIPYVTRNSLDAEVTIMGWNRVQAGQYRVVPRRRQTTYYRLEIECPQRALASIQAHPALETDPTYVPPPAVPLSSIPGFEGRTGTLQTWALPHTRSSEDAEMCESKAEEIQRNRDHIFAKDDGSVDVFPDERFESIVTWCFEIDNISVPGVTHRVGFVLGLLSEDEIAKTPMLRHCRLMTANPNGDDGFTQHRWYRWETDTADGIPRRVEDPVPDNAPTIYQFQSELQMLEALHVFKMTLQADMIIGYNTDGFDHPYLENRLTVLGSAHAGHFSYHVHRRQAWKNITIRGRNKTIMTIPGVFSYDLLKHIPTIGGPIFGGFQSFSLSYVSKRLLSDDKIDFPPSMVRRSHHMARGRVKLLLYCLKDCALPKRVIDKYRITPTHQSRMMCTEPQYLIDRGSMFRLLNCVLYFAKQFGPKLHDGRQLLWPTKWADPNVALGVSDEATRQVLEEQQLTIDAYMNTDQEEDALARDLDRMGLNAGPSGNKVPGSGSSGGKSKKREAQYDGAFNFPPRCDRDTGQELKNFFEGYMVLQDFTGLYPSVISEKNLCPTTLLLCRHLRDRLSYQRDYQYFLEADLVERAEPDDCTLDPDWNEIPQEEKERRYRLRDVHRRRDFVIRDYTPRPPVNSLYGMYGTPFPGAANVRPDRACFVNDSVQMGVIPKVEIELKALRDKIKGVMNRAGARRDTIGGTGKILGLKRCFERLGAFAANDGSDYGGLEGLREVLEYLYQYCHPATEGQAVPRGTARVGDLPPELLELVTPPPDRNVEEWLSEQRQGVLAGCAMAMDWLSQEWVKADFDWSVENARQDAVKLIMNSLYGMFGSVFGPCPVMEVAESTTKWGVFFIKFCMAYVEREFRPDRGCPFMATVEYGDTDSQAVWLVPILNRLLGPAEMMDEVFKYGKLIEKGCNREMREVYHTRYMNIELEKAFYNMMLDARKKYMAYWLMTNGDRAFKVKGMHCVRSDCAKFMAQLQKSVMEQRVVHDDFEGALNLAIDGLAKLLNHEVMNCDLMSSKSFSRDPEAYDNQAQSHVAVALRHAAEGTGKRYRAGMRMKTIAVKPEYMPASRVNLALSSVTQSHEEVLYALDNHMLYDEDHYLANAWKMLWRPLWRTSPYATLEELDKRVRSDPRLRKKRSMSVAARQEVLLARHQQEAKAMDVDQGSSSSTAPVKPSVTPLQRYQNGRLDSMFQRQPRQRCRVCQRSLAGMEPVQGAQGPCNMDDRGQLRVCGFCLRDGSFEEYKLGLINRVEEMQQVLEGCWDTCATCITNMGLVENRSDWVKEDQADLEDLVRRMGPTAATNLDLEQASGQLRQQRAPQRLDVVRDIEDIAEQCVADDCANLYRRKQSRDEVHLALTELQKLGFDTNNDPKTKFAANYYVSTYLLKNAGKVGTARQTSKK